MTTAKQVDGPWVFISHAADDRKVADALASALRKHDLVPWTPMENVAPAEHWHELIVDAIRRSTLGVVLLGRRTDPLNSWQSAEWSALQEAAWTRDDFSLCPVLLEDIEPPSFLRSWLSLRMGPSEREIEKVAGQLAELQKKPPKLIAKQSAADKTEAAQRFARISKALTQSEKKDPKILHALREKTKKESDGKD